MLLNIAEFAGVDAKDFVAHTSLPRILANTLALRETPVTPTPALIAAAVSLRCAQTWASRSKQAVLRSGTSGGPICNERMYVGELTDGRSGSVGRPSPIEVAARKVRAATSIVVAP